MVEFKEVSGHIEVYIGNKFVFSADSKTEAIKELEAQISLS